MNEELRILLWALGAIQGTVALLLGFVLSRLSALTTRVQKLGERIACLEGKHAATTVERGG